jgi:hypothetical protein
MHSGHNVMHSAKKRLSKVGLTRSKFVKKLCTVGINRHQKKIRFVIQ